MGRYPDSGGLFRNDKTSDRAPDMSGNIEISRELAEEITRQLTENGEASIRIAAWRKQGNKGDFYSLKVSAPMRRDNPPPQKRTEIDDEIPF